MVYTFHPNIIKLVCNGMKLKCLLYLPPTLKYLECNRNYLKRVDLNSFVEFLSLDGNKYPIKITFPDKKILFYLPHQQ